MMAQPRPYATGHAGNQGEQRNKYDVPNGTAVGFGAGGAREKPLAGFRLLNLVSTLCRLCGPARIG